MGKVFFLSGEIVVNGSRDAGVSDDNHDVLEAFCCTKSGEIPGPGNLDRRFPSWRI